MKFGLGEVNDLLKLKKKGGGGEKGGEGESRCRSGPGELKGSEQLTR